MSKARSERPGGMFDRPVLLLVIVAAVVMFAWVAFTETKNWHELVVGLAATALTTLFFANVLHSETLQFSLRWRDVAEGWRVPGYIVQDCWIVTRVLLRDLAGKRAGSYYRTFPFRASRRDPTANGRETLATVYSTMSPNSIVVGIDPAQSLMLFHQVERTEMPEVTKALGGQR